MAKAKKTPTPIVEEEIKEPITQAVLNIEEDLKPIKKTVNTYRLNVRKAPDFKAPIVRELEEGAEVTPLGEQEEWTEIGEYEWVMTKYLK